MRIARALVHQHKAHDGVVGRGRRDARIQPHVVVLGNIVIARKATSARRCLHYAALAQPAV